MIHTELYIGYSEAVNRLNVTPRSFAKLVKMGLVRKHVITGMTYGRYYAEDVERLVDAGVPRDPKIETKIRKLMDLEIANENRE